MPNRVQLSDLLLKPPQPQALQTLSLGGRTTADMINWLNGLKSVSSGESTRQLFITLKELVELNTDEPHRMALAELMRDPIHSTQQNLAKHFMSQSLPLIERPLQVAHLNHLMHTYLAQTYAYIAETVSEQLTTQNFGLFALPKKRQLLDLLGHAIHRALDAFGNLAYDLYRLYLPLPKGFWFKNHYLYALAMQHQLTSHSLADEHMLMGKILDIRQVYLRSILLSIADPYTLRQSEIQQLYQLGECWAEFISLTSLASENALFLVDLQQDTPPVYITKVQTGSQALYFLDTQPLLWHVEEVNSPDGQQRFHAEKNLLTPNLYQHLIHFLTAPLERQQHRHRYHGQLLLALGLNHVHYQLAERRTFDQVIDLKSIVEEITPLLDLQNPGLMDYTQPSVHQLPASSLEQSVEELNTTYNLNIINISLNGYCVHWQGQLPAQLRVGELLCVREASDPRWQLAVIRWITQIPNEGADFGIEVFTRQAQACGARVIFKDRDPSDYLRTFLMSDPRFPDRPATLITPVLTFKTGSKISLRLGQEEFRGQLEEAVQTTQSFVEFEFTLDPLKNAGRSLTTLTTPSATQLHDDDLWKML